MPRATTTIERFAKTATIAVALFAINCVSGDVADGQTAQAEKTAVPRGEGRLYNLTARPFTVQFHRVDGVKWSDGFVIQPGQFYAVRVPKPGEKSEIMGLTGNGEGFVIVRFRDAKLGGFRTLRLTATNPNNMKLEPTWFAVEDSSGIVNLVQQPGVAEAKTVQEGLQNQPALSAEELDRMKRTLRANYVLTD